MPIMDYKHKAELSHKHLFANEGVTEQNKEAVKRFLNQYDVSPARLNIFLKHIERLLELSQDITKEMQDRDKINTMFKSLRDRLSPVYYSTIVNVSLRFARWLNDGERPKGFKDIKNIPKKKQKRDLEPEDMITWENGLSLVRRTRSLQIKAAFLMQLDGGFRPSEFIDLNFGDLDIKKDFIIARVKGKTGKRDVTLWRSVPYVMRWLDSHPTKKASDPLWIKENGWGIERYEYPALAKRVRELGQKAKLKKHLDFYNLRHSSCTLDKLDNLPVDVAANRHGHSVEYFTETYGRLSTDDIIKRIGKHYGFEEDKKKAIEKNIVCESCDNVNEPKAQICSKCGRPLTITKAMELDKAKDLKLEQMQKQIDELTNAFQKVFNGVLELRNAAKAKGKS